MMTESAFYINASSMEYDHNETVLKSRNLIHQPTKKTKERSADVSVVSITLFPESLLFLSPGEALEMSLLSQKIVNLPSVQSIHHFVC